MSTSSVNKIYAQFTANQLNQEQTVTLLVSEIFRTPQHYGLIYFSEDTKSEFFVWIYKYIPHLIERYEPQKSSFYTYLTNAIRMYSKSWKRSCAKNAAKTTVLDTYCLEMDEETQCDIADKEPQYATAAVPSTSTDSVSLNLTERQKLTILVLTLKSAQDINFTYIQKTSVITGIPIETIENYTKELTETLQFKRKRLETIVEKKNKAYIRSKQYEVELENMNNTNDTQYHIVSKKLETQRQIFKKSLIQLDRFGSIAPSNSAIERLLGLTTGTVRRILKQAQNVSSTVKELLDHTNTGW